MKSALLTLQPEQIERMIFVLRGKKVMLDTNLAQLYQVPTFRLNEAVKRNMKRFPDDFMFQLSNEEKREVIANCDNLKKLKFSGHLPYAFTEQGVAMLSSVLNSERAVQVNIQVMRAFSYLREMLETHTDLKRKIEEMEKRYDGQFQVVFKALRKLLYTPMKSKRMIGFHP